jgi:hypothetical protein
MLSKLPTYSMCNVTHAMCSAIDSEDFSAPEPAASEKPAVWSFTRKELVREDEDWVLL